MTNTTDIIPIEFVPYETVEICSNKLINGYAIIGIGDFAPLLIGKGETPQVWFYYQDAKGNWLPLIQQNTSSTPRIKIENKIENKSTRIWMESTLIIEAYNQLNDYCKITQIDLRPLGLNIYGTDKELFFAGNSFKNNKFSMIKYMFGISPQNIS